METEEQKNDLTADGEIMQAQETAENNGIPEFADEDAEAFEGGGNDEYERRAQEDLAEIKRLYPRLAHLKSLTQIDNPARFAQLRDLGLSAREAFLATNSGRLEKRGAYDNRSHLVSSVPRANASTGTHMSRAELASAKDIFGNLSEKEIEALWKKVQG